MIDNGVKACIVAAWFRPAEVWRPDTRRPMRERIRAVDMRTGIFALEGAHANVGYGDRFGRRPALSGGGDADST